MDLVCVNEHNVALARIRWGTTAKTGTGEIDIFAAELAKGGKGLDEVVVSGLAYVHLSLNMTMYAGSVGAGGILIT